MSFAQELKGFVKGMETASTVMYRNQARRTAEKNEPLFGPEDYREGRVPGAFQPGSGGRVGETSAPQVTGGTKSSIKRTGNDEYANRRDAIASIESSGNYRAVGAQTGKGRGMGRYQVMDFNVGPWTKQILGREMTPGEFLADDKAQDAVFDGMFDGYVKKFGLGGAAQAWLGGPGSVGKNVADMHGTSTGDYANKFMSFYNGFGGTGEQPATETARSAAPNEPLYNRDREEDQPAIPDEAAPEEEPVAVDSPDIDAPDPNLQPVAQAPQVEDEEDPRLYMAAGGVIPEDENVQRFQTGGQPDPFNPSRGFTQMNTAGYTPPQQGRRIQLPAAGAGGAAAAPSGGGWRDWGAAGGTPAQLALRKTRADQAAAAAAAAAAKAQPAAAPAGDWQKAMQYQQQAEALRNRAYRPPLEGHKSTGQMRIDPMAKAQYDRYQQQVLQTTKAEKAAGRDPWLAVSQIDPNSFRQPVRGFARGGKVADRDKETEFQKRQRVQERFQNDRMTSAGNTARDRAARQMNVSRDRPNSTAYRDPYLRPARAPAPVTGGRPTPMPSRVPTPTPRPQTGGGDVGGAMPQVDTMGNPVGANYPPGFDTAAETSAAIRQDPGWAHVQAKQEEMRRRQAEAAPYPPAAPWLRPPAAGEAPPSPLPMPGEEELVTQPAMRGGGMVYAEGGVIPDEPGYAQGGSIRAESANYQRRKAKPKSDQWAGMRTKTSQRKKKASTDKPQARQQRKQKRSRPTPERGVPTPTPRPEQQVAGVPTPTARPQTLPETGAPTPTARPGTAAGVPPVRPQQGPPASAATPPPPYQLSPDWGGPLRAGHPPNPTVGARDPAAALRTERRPPTIFDQQQIPPRPRIAMPDTSLPEGSRTVPPDLSQARVVHPPNPEVGRPPQQAFLHGNPYPAPGSGVTAATPSTAPPATDEEGSWWDWLNPVSQAYAQGGMIPDDEEGPYPNSRAEEAGYTTSSADPRVVAETRMPREAASAGATPVDQPMEVDTRTLLEHAAPSVKAGTDGLARIFGLGQQQGAIATPEDAARQDQGARRFAQGEGAATRDEINEIDQVIGMGNIQADEGMKNLMRIDKVAQYYLMRGDKDKAEAASASLLQHGAVQVRQAGIMASAAFEEWQQTGDPADLQRASAFVERAHAMIPDGVNMKIDIDPKTRQIVATVAGPDGKSEKHVVDPQMIPQLLKGAMDGSAYWKSVYQIGQPRLAEQEISQAGQNQRAADTRDYEGFKNEREAQEEQYRHDRDVTEGKSAGERRQYVTEQKLNEWRQRYSQAAPEGKPQLMQEGLKLTWEGSPDRRTPVDSTQYGFTGTAYDGQFEDTDVQAMRGIAQAIAQKNPTLDAPGAMEATAAIVMAPETPRVGANGTLDSGGLSLVFNPALLPQLGELRKRLKQ